MDVIIVHLQNFQYKINTQFLPPNAFHAVADGNREVDTSPTQTSGEGIFSFSYFLG